MCTVGSFEGWKENDYDCVSAVISFVLLHYIVPIVLTTCCTLLVGRTRTVIVLVLLYYQYCYTVVLIALVLLGARS